MSKKFDWQTFKSHRDMYLRLDKRCAEVSVQISNLEIERENLKQEAERLMQTIGPMMDDFFANSDKYMVEQVLVKKADRPDKAGG